MCVALWVPDFRFQDFVVSYFPDEVTMKKLEPDYLMVRRIASGASARVFEGVVVKTGEVT